MPVTAVGAGRPLGADTLDRVDRGTTCGNLNLGADNADKINVSRVAVGCQMVGFVLVVLVAGCRGPGPEVERLETALTVLGDFDDLDSGERVKYSRWNSPAELLRDGTLSGHHVQSYIPTQGHSIDDVLSEVLSKAGAAGWELEETSIADPARWKGERAALDGRTYVAYISIGDDTYSKGREKFEYYCGAPQIRSHHSSLRQTEFDSYGIAPDRLTNRYDMVIFSTMRPVEYL